MMLGVDECDELATKRVSGRTQQERGMEGCNDGEIRDKRNE